MLFRSNATDPGMIVHVVQVALRGHLKSADITGFVDNLARCSHPAAERALQTILTSSPHKEVKGKACYQLGMKKLSAARLARRVQVADADELTELQSNYSLVALDRAKGIEAKMMRSEEHTSELQSRRNLVCRLLLEKKNTQR